MTTLNELFTDCYEARWANTRSAQKNMYNGLYLLEKLGQDTPVESITVQRMDRLVKEMKQDGNKPATINRKLAILSSMFTYAKERELVLHTPFIPKQKVSNGRIRVISLTEESAIQKLYSSHWLADVLSVGIDTGMRMGELLFITEKDIREGILTVPASLSKNNKSRRIPLTQRASDILMCRGLSALEYPQVIKTWHEMKDRLGITDSDFVPHAMRHTFCSRLADKGVSPFIIKELAGHSSLQMTERYTHMSEGHLKEAIQILEGS